MVVAADDPRLQQCGFAKLEGEHVHHIMRKYEIILGRKSKSKDTDVVLGDVMSVSREHAKIYYNFDTSEGLMLAAMSRLSRSCKPRSRCCV